MSERIKYFFAALAIRTFFGLATGALCAAITWFPFDNETVIAIAGACGFVLGFIFGRRALEAIWETEFWTPW